MAISDTQKVDLLYKKVAFGLTKTDIAGNKSPSNESIASEVPTFAQDIYAESDQIPSVPPTSTSSIVEVLTVANGNSQINLTEDTTATPRRTFLTNLRDWIPFSFGSLYAVKVYIGDPASSGTQIFPGGSGNDDEFFFDYQAGVLNFIGNNIPAGVTSTNIYIEGYRYVGNKGIQSTVTGSSNAVRNYATIAARDADSNVKTNDLALVDDNGDGEYAFYVANAVGPTTNWTLLSTRDSVEGDDSKTVTYTVNFNDSTAITTIANPSQDTRISSISVDVTNTFDATGSILEIRGNNGGSVTTVMADDEIDLTDASNYVTFTNFVFTEALDADNQIEVDFTQGTGGTQGQATVTVSYL